MSWQNHSTSLLWLEWLLSHLSQQWLQAVTLEVAIPVGNASQLLKQGDKDLRSQNKPEWAKVMVAWLNRKGWKRQIQPNGTNCTYEKKENK